MGLNCRTLQLEVPETAQAIQDHPRQLQFGPQPGVPQHCGGHTPAHAARVHHQHNGQAQAPGQVGGGTLETHGIGAIEEAHHSFHERQLRPGASTSEGFTKTLIVLKKTIQIPGGASSCNSVQHRIQIVRARLEGRDVPPLVTEGPQNPSSQGGLSTTGMRPRQKKGWKVHV